MATHKCYSSVSINRETDKEKQGLIKWCFLSEPGGLDVRSVFIIILRCYLSFHSHSFTSVSGVFQVL